MTPSSASPVKPILPGVPVPLPCWLWHEPLSSWCYKTRWPSQDLLANAYTHYLVAPATADPATFPKAETVSEPAPCKYCGSLYLHSDWCESQKNVTAPKLPLPGTTFESPSAGTEQKERGEAKWVPLLEVVELLHHRNFYWGSMGGLTGCKYLDLRIDTRDNQCVMRDRDGSPVDLDRIRKALESPIRADMNSNPEIQITKTLRAT